MPHQTKTGQLPPHQTTLWPDCMKTEDYYGGDAYGQEEYDQQHYGDFYGSQFITGIFYL